MPYKKLEKIGLHYGTIPEALIPLWYNQEKLSGEAIARKIRHEANISITSRAIHDFLKKLGISRSKSSARQLGIVTGRVDYSHLRKSSTAKELRRGIAPGLRYEIMKRDGFRCVLCGQDASETRLVIDHIAAVVNGGTNDKHNLRTLCFECNHGKKIYEKEK